MDELLDRLDALAGANDLEAVESLARRGLADHPGDPDLARWLAWARFEQGALEGALEAARAGDDALYEGKALFHLWRFDEAARALGRVRGEGEEEAEAEWYRGLCAEFSGGDPGSHFARAAALSPDFPLPAALDEAEIDAVVRDAVAALPPDVARAVEETVIEVRDLPRPHPDVDPLSLGLYLGSSRLERVIDESGQLPSRIEIYRRNVERIARDRAEAVDELRITLLHEIGHHLGFGEEGVAGLGLA